jgi:arylsulfatase A-like enzyme
MSSLDLFPTIVAATGAQLPQDRSLDGVDLIPHLTSKNKQAPHPYLFWRAGDNLTVQDGRWKLWQYGQKLTMLFDLEKDVSETTNVARQHPEVVQRLSQQLQAWNAQLVPPLWKTMRPVEKFEIENTIVELTF